jgi:hypothetical protein
MALPYIPIVATVTPLVLGAFELLRGRSAAKEERLARQEERDHARSLAALEARLRALEDADLEQARLVSELAASLEGAARASEALERAIEARIGRHERLVWIALAAGFAALSLSTWSLVH